MRWLLFIGLLLPALITSWQVFFAQNITDPIKYIYTVTGTTSIILLFATTTLSLIKNKVNLITYRRQIGLFGFFYALLHFFNFLVFDMQFDIIFAFEETLDKPFIYLGMVAFLILLFMASTSTKKLFARYNKYHKALYVALILATVHFIMAQKSLNTAQYFYLVLIGFILFFKFKQRLHF